MTLSDQQIHTPVSYLAHGSTSNSKNTTGVTPRPIHQCLLTSNISDSTPTTLESSIPPTIAAITTATNTIATAHTKGKAPMADFVFPNYTHMSVATEFNTTDLQTEIKILEKRLRAHSVLLKTGNYNMEESQKLERSLRLK